MIITKIKDKIKSARLLLVAYDILTFLFVSVIFLLIHPSSNESSTPGEMILCILLGLFLILLFRSLFGTYRQIWRYGGQIGYLRLIAADCCACLLNLLLAKTVVPTGTTAVILFTIYVVNCLLSLIERMLYALLYRRACVVSQGGVFARKVLKVFADLDVNADTKLMPSSRENLIRIAIIGAGRLGISLAEELESNPKAMFLPVCFVDSDVLKQGRLLSGLPVYSTELFDKLLSNGLEVDELVFTLPNASMEERLKLYEHYRGTGCRIKCYDLPHADEISDGKISLRDFQVEDLLPRRSVALGNEDTDNYYAGKVVLVSGGGGSIGTELCRQIMAKGPKQLVILDIAENTTYNLLVELTEKYGKNSGFIVEISSITDRDAMRSLFEKYRPQIVLHAAAHKHVPLMEHNCVEAVKNNIFGTEILLDLCKEYGVEKFVLVSSDKAVNPVNVMGATKRFCEMLCLQYPFSCAVRFGNVMGSAGSVVPIFRRQIENGGPVTITDKRITRYFMTISEASGLILESGAKAGPGDLFVLDMGQPVKILTLAEEMVRLSGFEPYRDIGITEIGLRPGEKLYEELLMDSRSLTRTDNQLIYIENEEQPSQEELDEAMDCLRRAVATQDDSLVKSALKDAVPTYLSPEEVNSRIPV